MPAQEHHRVSANGIQVHVVSQGEGPLVLLYHGFPEGWYAWRHQLPALAKAGYRAVAPDLRGYGGTDAPRGVEAYDLLHATADAVALVHALGEEQAVIMGHDWGAHVAANGALLRPDVFRGAGLLSIPYSPLGWGDPPPIASFRAAAAGQQMYLLWFQEPGVAERALDADVAGTLRRFFVSASGDAEPEERFPFFYPMGRPFADVVPDPRRLPPWLRDEDLATFVEAFETTGFRGALNWYRNMDRNREILAVLTGARIRQPTLFVAGDQDLAITMRREAYDALEDAVPGLWHKSLLPGAGHWIQQERPDEVNALLVAFLRALDR